MTMRRQIAGRKICVTRNTWPGTRRQSAEICPHANQITADGDEWLYLQSHGWKECEVAEPG
jgi:hypothetical protein